MSGRQAVFDDFARGEAQERHTYAPGRNLRVDAAARALRAGRFLLDVGCGAGVLGPAVAGRFERVYGVDIAAGCVAAARGNGLEASQVDLDEAPLPFEPGFFDAVTVLSVLQYFRDPLAVLRECHRVLRPSGQLLLASPNMRSAGKLWRQFVVGRFPTTSKGAATGWDGGALHYFCSRDLRELLEATGFRVLETTGLFCRPRGLERVPDGLPLLGRVKVEFLSGEVLLLAERE
jgi:methionine biosynthesis protein MetW